MTIESQLRSAYLKGRNHWNHKLTLKLEHLNGDFDKLLETEHDQLLPGAPGFPGLHLQEAYQAFMVKC